MKGDILLTGATGLIGGEIAVKLARSRWRVWCVVRGSSYGEAAARLAQRFTASGEACDWSKVVAVPGNVTQPFLGLANETVRYLRDRCRLVIHCAADTSFASGDHCASVNITGTKNILDFCLVLAPDARLFHISSAAVCLYPENTLISEETPFGGFSNGYVTSKRRCEGLVLQSRVDAAVLRPSIVLSQGIRSREFARSVLWVFPVIRSLGILPLTGEERLDVVSVRHVAQAVVRMIERPLFHRVYHVSAGPEVSVTWKEVFETLTGYEHDYSQVRFDPGVDWERLGRTEPSRHRLKKMLSYYLPFMRAGVVYDNRRLRHCLGMDFPDCPRGTDYCADLLDQFTDREAFEEALKP